jgi:hypothetical protein
MKVLILPEVRKYFKELSQILYNKDYFSHIETSERYIDELIFDIEKTLHARVKKTGTSLF